MTRRSNVALLGDQIGYHLRSFRRNGMATFFTLIFPLMFLVLFQLLFGGTISTPGGELSIAQFFAPSLGAWAAANAAYSTLAISTAIDRELGVLKRFRGTPLPAWLYLVGRVVASVLLALLAVTLMMGLGVVAYGVEVEVAKLPAALLTFVVGVASFAALGFVVSAVSRDGDAATAIANATLLPMAFISNVFIPIEDPPAWLDTLSNLLPLRHFVDPMLAAFSPFTEAPALRWGDLAILGLWGVAGTVAALRLFTWEVGED